jgi:hypothetical protein
MRRVVMLSLLAGLTACALRTPGDALRLEAIRPDSVLIASGAVVLVVLHGRGFVPGQPGQNTVMFGTHALRNVPANADGTQIMLAIPETLPSGGEAPPVQVDAGAYEIRVRTAAGESNRATVRIFR